MSININKPELVSQNIVLPIATKTNRGCSPIAHYTLYLYINTNVINILHKIHVYVCTNTIKLYLITPHFLHL